MTKNRVTICLAIVIALFQPGVTTAQKSLEEMIKKSHDEDMRILNELQEGKSANGFHLMFDIGVSKTSHKLAVREDWQEMFLPPSNRMMLNSFKPPWTLGFGLGYSRVLAGNWPNWKIRLPISYQVFSIDLSNTPLRFHLAKKVVAGTTLDWWDRVMVNDLIVEHFTPRVGIEIGKGDYGIGFSVQHYRLSLRDYKGKDHYGAVNTSKVINSRQIESGVSLRMDLFLIRSHFYKGSMGFYVESMGGFKTVNFGLTAYSTYLSY